MAAKGYSTVQLDDAEESDEELLTSDTTNNLKFQEFSSNVLVDSVNQASFEKTAFEDENEDDDDDDDEDIELLSQDKKPPSFWAFEYYQSFFDVDTEQVLSRLLYSIVPGRQNYLLTKIRPTPDYYGPFWVCTTLVFTIAICGNLSSFFASEGNVKWKSDFQLVSLSAGVIFCYAWIIPACLWSFLTWRGNIAGFTFFEILCVYGYSLAVFIPISIMWVAPYDWLRWILVVVGVTASGSVLALTFWRAVEDDKKQVALLSIGIILFLHLALAIGFKLYFFKTIRIHHESNVTPTTILSTSIRSTLSSTMGNATQS